MDVKFTGYIPREISGGYIEDNNKEIVRIGLLYPFSHGGKGTLWILLVRPGFLLAGFAGSD